MERTPLVGKNAKKARKSTNENDLNQEPLFFTQRQFLQKWLILLIVSLLVIAFLTSSWFSNFFGRNDRLPNAGDYYSNLLGNNPFAEYTLCQDESSPPSLSSYHIHAVFDGSDEKSSQFAIKSFYQFKEYINPDMDECPFSHNNAGLTQKEICYFPFYFDETDFPISSHKLWDSAQFAFFLPSDYVEIGLNWWMQHRYASDEISFDLALHPAVGCQEMSHSKWLVTNNEFSTNLIYENLPCCHTGPASCTCDLVSFKEETTQLCLSLNYNSDAETLSFQLSECQDYSMVQNVIAKFTFDNELSKIRYLGDDLKNDTPMCLLISTTENDNENEMENESETRMVDAKLVDCNDATLFTRVFFP